MLSPKPSKAKADWDRQKSQTNSSSQEIDELMKLTGLESVKRKMVAIYRDVHIARMQNLDLSRRRFGTVFVGNPGTGKTTVGRLYGKFLAFVGIIPGHKFNETTGSRLAIEGVKGCRESIDNLLREGGGVLFIDEAYQLIEGSGDLGKQVLEFLVAEIENLTGKIVFILGGYEKKMEKLLAHNQGLSERFPCLLKFEDFDDAELMQIMEIWIRKTWGDKMVVEDGLGGLYCRIAARRIGRLRGQDGFANARAVENAMARVCERQSKRLSQSIAQGGSFDHFFLDKQDLLGPDPSLALRSSEAMQKLQNMMGMTAVKNTVQGLLNTVQYNYRRELNEQPLVEYGLNKVFLGNPGTGKTSVAKIYGQILVDIGLLSNGEVVVKNPSDFVGGAIGESEQKTRAILAATVGKVLVIDEAYGLFGGGSSDHTEVRTDQYRSAVVDTLVAEVQGTPGDDRCIMLLGYKQQMQQLFQNVNPGLSRRFPIDQAFVFEDFTQEELEEILRRKLIEQGIGITNRAKLVVSEMLERARHRPHFGNAGEIDNLLNAAKMRYQRRLASRDPACLDDVLDAIDFDENFDRAEKAGITQLFEGMVGCESIMSELKGLQDMVKTCKQINLDPHEMLPFNFIFRGPPGTGKTSMGRKMGQVYYDMGVLASNEVVECSATDLVGQYIGQTGPKTQKILERALGKVLIVDEAYRLASGQYGREAIDELVDCITKPKFAGKLIIILAGYDADIDRLMSVNPGFKSRFPKSFQFEALAPRACAQLLAECLRKRKKDLAKSDVELDISLLQSSNDGLEQKISQCFATLLDTESWANARDVQTLAKAIFSKTLRAPISAKRKILSVSETNVLEELKAMIYERSTPENRAKITPPAIKDTTPAIIDLVDRRKSLIRTPEVDQPETRLGNKPLQVEVAFPEPNTKLFPGAEIASDKQQQVVVSRRDPRVTDEVWNQLQKDKAAAKGREIKYLRVQKEEEEKRKEAESLQKDWEEKEMEIEELKKRSEEEERAKETKRRRINYETRERSEMLRREEEEEAKWKAAEQLRRQEEALVRTEQEYRAWQAQAKGLKRQRHALEEARHEEQATQELLHQQPRVCPQGFIWIKQDGGYRCDGGACWVTDGEIKRLREWARIVESIHRN